MNSPNSKTSLVLLRHGQPQLQDCLLGRTDSKLTELGWHQMQIVSANLKGIDHVISSPLLRCKQFALEFAIKNGIPFECDPDWQECDFGDWDGKRYKDLHHENTDAFNEFIATPEKNSPPHGETLIDFNQRIDGVLNRVITSHKGKTVLIVSHAGVIRNLIAWTMAIERLSNKPYQRYSVDYGSVCQIDLFDGTEILPQLKYMNRVPERGL